MKVFEILILLWSKSNGSVIIIWNIENGMCSGMVLIGRLSIKIADKVLQAMQRLESMIVCYIITIRYIYLVNADYKKDLKWKKKQTCYYKRTISIFIFRLLHVTANVCEPVILGERLIIELEPLKKKGFWNQSLTYSNLWWIKGNGLFLFRLYEVHIVHHLELEQ